MHLKYKSFKEIILSVILGFFIGLSIIIPGLSGSIVAMAMKIYDKLLYSFANILKKFKSCFIFLIPIGIGAVVGFGVGLILVKLLLDKFPFQTICFFVGLMIGAYPIIHEEIKGKEINVKRILLYSIGIIIPICLSLLALNGGSNDLSNLELHNYLIFVVIGALIALTQIMPGLSATALLMVCGYYTVLMESIGFDLLNNFDIILVFVALLLGCGIGILAFSKVINRMLEKHKISFYFLICGLAVGSIISIFIGPDCIEIYKAWSNSNIILILASSIICLICGFIITYFMVLYEKKHKNIEGKE